MCFYSEKEHVKCIYIIAYNEQFQSLKKKK